MQKSNNTGTQHDADECGPGEVLLAGSDSGFPSECVCGSYLFLIKINIAIAYKIIEKQFNIITRIAHRVHSALTVTGGCLSVCLSAAKSAWSAAPSTWATGCGPVAVSAVSRRLCLCCCVLGWLFMGLGLRFAPAAAACEDVKGRYFGADLHAFICQRHQLQMLPGYSIKMRVQCI